MDNKPNLAIGQVVSPAQWNGYTAKKDWLIEPCVVINIEPQIKCQSGLMVTIKDAQGVTLRLDSSWLY